MDAGLTKRPPGIAFNALSEAVFEVLSDYTAFPWPVMLAQCKRVAADPANLTKKTLSDAMPHLVMGVARFTSPEKGARVEQALRALL